MSNLKQMNTALEKAKSPKEIFTIDFVQDRAIKNYQAVTGRKDGSNWYQGEVLAIMDIIAQKPDYAKADKMSIWGCLMTAGRKGLSIADGHMDLVPYNKGAILKAEPNYKGLRKQMHDMEEIKFIHEAQVVWESDVFVHDKLNNRISKHESESVPKDTSLNNIKCAYVRIEFKDGHIADVVMYKHELLVAKNKSKNKFEDGPWNVTPGEMCKKSVLKRANKIYYNKTQAEIADDEFSKFKGDDDEPETTVETTHEEVITTQAEVVKSGPSDSELDEFLK